jgi:hypothetical protein
VITRAAPQLKQVHLVIRDDGAKVI